MTRSRLLLGVAAVLAGASVLFVVLGAAFNLILVGVAVPFGIAAYFLWAHATGRLQERIRHRVVERERAPPGSARRTETGGADRTTRWRTEDGVRRSMDRREAFAALDLSPGADQPAIRRAYRNRVKAVHPDAEGGDEDEFRRVRAAYEALRRSPRGKG